MRLAGTLHQICNYNRHGAENAGYFKKTSWLAEVGGAEETTYYDRSRPL